MNESTEDLQRKIKQAGDLEGVVKTMKAIAASNIGQYQRAVRALDFYYKNILLGVQAYFRHQKPSLATRTTSGATLLIVFGSDQGLVGPFNHSVSQFVRHTISSENNKTIVWAVGERVHYLLADAGLSVTKIFYVPGSIRAVTTLTDRLLLEIDQLLKEKEVKEIYSAFNRPRKIEDYAPVLRKLLPFDDEWIKKTSYHPWPSNKLPQVVGTPEHVFSALFRDYLFTSLYRACAYSLASENTSRLSAMQRAEKNIEELSEQLHADYHRLRQDSIDSELFDIIAGFNALKKQQ